MKEATLFKKVKEILQKQGWVYWNPPKVRWKREKDIFGCFDLIAVRKNMVRFIQITTFTNMRTREKKVRKFLTENSLSLFAEVWAWHRGTKKLRKGFRKVKVV